MKLNINNLASLVNIKLAKGNLKPNSFGVYPILSAYDYIKTYYFGNKKENYRDHLLIRGLLKRGY